jgi:hypothetical protein
VCSVFAFCVGGSLEVMQSRVDTRPCGRGGAVPTLLRNWNSGRRLAKKEF